MNDSKRRLVERFIVVHLLGAQVWHVLTKDHTVLPDHQHVY